MICLLFARADYSIDKTIEGNEAEAAVKTKAENSIQTRKKWTIRNIRL